MDSVKSFHAPGQRAGLHRELTQVEASAHLLHQLRADGEPQPRPAFIEPKCLGSLAKWVEDTFAILRVNTRPCVNHAHNHVGRVLIDPNTNAAVIRKTRGIAQQVQDYLPNALS